MAVLKMEEFNLIIFEEDKKEVLNEMQNFKEVDFRLVNLEEDGYMNFVSSKSENIDDKLFKIDQTMKKLRKYTISKGLLKGLKEGKREYSYKELSDFIVSNNVDDIILKISNLSSDYEANIKNIENAKAKIQEYRVIETLDIKEDDIKNLKQVKIDIGNISTKNFENFKIDIDELAYIEIIHETNKEIILSIISNLESYENVKEILRKYNFNTLNIELKKEAKEYIKTFEEKIEKSIQHNLQIEQELKDLSASIEILEITYEYYKNEKLREDVSEKFAKTDKLIILKGYIPSDRKQEFENHIKQVCSHYYHLELKEAELESNDVPIKLKNGIFSDAFEGLVKTYSLPKYNEVDPTPLVAPFYWLFFGMMVADFGYGLVVSLISYIVLKTCKLQENMKKNIKFFFYLGFSIMLWGMIYGSYFSLPLNVPKLIDPATEYNKILAISVIIGFIHIFVGLGVKAYSLIKNGKIMDAVYDVGLWYITLITVALVIGGNNLGLSSQAVNISKYIMIASMIGIILTGGREVKNLGGRIGLGTYALYGISGYMGDLISYARLMALGLSGGFIAQSVNQICAMIGFKPLTLVFVLIIFLFGQTFNLLLSLLGAYVHSARLIYVEFFGKFYEGGGKEFKDFKIDEKYINIKEDKK